MDPDSLARDVLDSLMEGCQVIGFDWRYLYVNDAVAAQGHRTKDELVGRTMMECYPGIDATPMFDELRRTMKDRVRGRMENEFLYPDGSKGWFELHFIPVPEGVCVLSMEVTQRKRSEAALARSEEQFRQAQKMDAVGRLAGGVAHDFNNLLSVILSYASLAREGLPADHAVRADLAEIETAGRRAAELTQQLLSFSRQKVVSLRVLDLNRTIVGLDKMLRPLIGEDVHLRVIPAPDLWPVKADAGLVEQILVNLAVNARDAMPKGGNLTIETANVELDEEYVDEHLGTHRGPHVMLAVSDTGHGMDRAIQARIFEPFFTTKGQGRGTGLGLSTVFGIVQQVGGSIWVYSEPDAGTTFKIYFPRTHQVPDEDVAPVPKPAPRTGKETILLVEDDAQLRAVASAILRRAGYQVLAAAGPEEALALAGEEGRQVDLLLTDVVMPVISGRVLADRLRAARPALKVLYVSGYTDNVVVHHGVLGEGAPFLQKPITPDALTRAVRAVLDGTFPSGGA